MQRGYSYLDGVEELLGSLKQNGYEMHAATNYPIWSGPLVLVSFISSEIQPIYDCLLIIYIFKVPID